MDIIVKLNEQTIGRDRIIRLLQYGSRACWYYTQNSTNIGNSVDVLRSLEYTFSSFRKLLRLGRFLDSLYSASKAMTYPDLVLRITLTLSKVTNALFLLSDHIIWMGRVGVTRVNIEKWNNTANKYWLLTIIINLTRDIYEILKLMEKRYTGTLLKTDFYSKYEILKHCGAILLRDHREVLIDSVKNGCDLFIPMTALGYTKFSPGAVGILGFASSLIGLYTLIHPYYKLSPS